jgi:ribosomal protein S18 acetylase RimI-like enzyme
MSATVRELRVADRSRWEELWTGYLTFYKTELPAQWTDHLWGRLIDPDDQPYGFVALGADERLVGFVIYHFHLSTWSPAGYCYLEDLYVDPACRGSGAGRALIQAVYRAADERGAARVYWHTENTNARAQVLYNQVAVLTPFVQYRRK